MSNKDKQRTFNLKIELEYSAYDKMDACDDAYAFIRKVRDAAWPHMKLLNWSMIENGTETKQEAVESVCSTGKGKKRKHSQA